MSEQEEARAPEGAEAANTDAQAQAGGEIAAETTSPGATSAPPGGPISFQYWGATDVGLVREHNEDNFLVADIAGDVAGLPGGEIRTGELGSRGLVLAVCDGMGGAAAGEVASQMAVDTLFEVMTTFEPTGEHDDFARRLVVAIEEAGSRIYSAAKMDRTRRGMGTTSTVAGLVDEVLFVGQVGDSRCYVLRDGKLTLVTKDQSLVNQLIEAGQLTEEEADQFEHSNIILQALGTTERVSVDLTFLELRRGDRIMLCSDGLSGLVHAEMMRETLLEERDLQTCAARLIEMANNGGGHDNITCIVADFDGEGLAPLEAAPEPSYQQYPLPPSDGVGPDGPVRDPTVKAAAIKPGADVKRGPMDTVDPDPVVPVAPFPWWVVLVLGAVLTVLGGAALLSHGGSDGDDERPQRRDESGEGASAAPTTPESTTLRVSVITDVPNAHLFVDADDKGIIPVGVERLLDLEPGAYSVKAVVDGVTVTSETARVVAGERAPVIELRMPEGSAPAPEAPAPAPGSAGAEAPEGGAPAPGAPAPSMPAAPSTPE